MKVTTEQGHELEISVDDYKGDKIIVFGNRRWAYHFDTLLKIKDNEGLCLEGKRYGYVSVTAETIQKCKEWIRNQPYTEADALQDEIKELAKLEAMSDQEWSEYVQPWQAKKFTRQEFIRITKNSIRDLTPKGMTTIMQNGQPAPNNKTLQIDHTISSFTIVIKTMGNVGEADIKQLLQKKYEVINVIQENKVHVAR